MKYKIHICVHNASGDSIRKSILEDVEESGLTAAMIKGMDIAKTFALCGKEVDEGYRFPVIIAECVQID